MQLTSAIFSSPCLLCEDSIMYLKTLRTPSSPCQEGARRLQCRQYRYHPASVATSANVKVFAQLPRIASSAWRLARRLNRDRELLAVFVHRPTSHLRTLSSDCATAERPGNGSQHLRRDCSVPLPLTLDNVDETRTLTSLYRFDALLREKGVTC